MWSNPQLPADLVTLTEEILNGKLWSEINAVKSQQDSSDYGYILEMIRARFYCDLNNLNNNDLCLGKSAWFNYL